MLLHTFNKSPYSTKLLTSCLNLYGENDALVLLEDGVYAGAHPDLAEMLYRNKRVYAIEADVRARGLVDFIPDAIEIIDYSGFVALCAEFPKQKAW